MRALLVGCLVLILFLSWVQIPPADAPALSEPLASATTPQILSITPAYPSQLAQPRIYPTYKFLLNGGVYAWNNLGDNISLVPSITGFSANLVYNSSVYQYSATILTCTIRVMYKVVNKVDLKQTITGTGCPTGAYSFTVANLKGFSPSQSGCRVTYNSIIYTWCDAVTSGITITYANQKITFTVTSSSFTIDPSIVQKSGTTCSSPNCQRAFASNTVANNLLVAAVAIVDTTTTCGTATISDTQSNSYTSINSATKAGTGNCFFTQMWWARTTSAAGDTISVAYSRSLVDSASGIFIYELSGVTGTGLASSTGSGSGAPPTIATGSVTFSANAILIATMSIGEGTVGTVAAGSGFTLDQSASPNSNQQSAASGVSSPTTFPFSQSGNSGTQYFSEVSAQFPAQISQTVTLTVSPAGQTQATMTLSGGGVDPTTAAGDGTAKTITCDSGATITTTVPTDGASTRHRFSPLSSIWDFTCDATNDSNTYYFQQRLSVRYTITGAGSFIPPVITRTILASSGTSALTTTATDLWVDGGTSWSTTNPLTGASSSERRQAGSGTSGTAAAAGSVNPNYFLQFTCTCSYAVKGGGSSNDPTFNGQRFGSSTGDVLSKTAATVWVDDAFSWTITPNPLGGPSTAERWLAPSGLAAKVSAAFTSNPSFYRQCKVTAKVANLDASVWGPSLTIALTGSSAGVAGSSLGSLTPTAGTFSIPSTVIWPDCVSSYTFASPTTDGNNREWVAVDPNVLSESIGGPTRQINYETTEYRDAQSSPGGVVGGGQGGNVSPLQNILTITSVVLGLPLILAFVVVGAIVIISRGRGGRT